MGRSGIAVRVHCVIAHDEWLYSARAALKSNSSALNAKSAQIGWTQILLCALELTPHISRTTKDMGLILGNLLWETEFESTNNKVSAQSVEK